MASIAFKKPERNRCRSSPIRIRTILSERAIDGAMGSRPMASGKAFTDRRFGLRKRAATGQHAFDQRCADLGIEHRLAPPQHPRPTAWSSGST